MISSRNCSQPATLIQALVAAKYEQHTQQASDSRIRIRQKKKSHAVTAQPQLNTLIQHVADSCLGAGEGQLARSHPPRRRPTPIDGSQAWRSPKNGAAQLWLVSWSRQRARILAFRPAAAKKSLMGVWQLGGWGWALWADGTICHAWELD